MLSEGDVPVDRPRTAGSGGKVIDVPLQRREMLSCYVLAAGKGERFFQGSSEPTALFAGGKTLYPFMGIPLLHHVLDRVLELNRRMNGGIERLTIVTLKGDLGQRIQESVASAKQYGEGLDRQWIKFLEIEETPQRGTAYSLFRGLPSLPTWMRHRPPGSLV